MNATVFKFGLTESASVSERVPKAFGPWPIGIETRGLSEELCRVKFNVYVVSQPWPFNVVKVGVEVFAVYVIPSLQV